METAKEYLENADRHLFEYLTQNLNSARNFGDIKDVEYWHQKIEELHDHIKGRAPVVRGARMPPGLPR